MTRILCISPAFLPQGGSESLCGGKMVLALRRQGADVTVLSDPGMMTVGNRRVDTSRMWDELHESTVGLDVSWTRSILASAWQSVRLRALLTHPRWVEIVVAAAERLHRNKPFDVVYSRSLPMRAHVAGYWCSRRLGVPWIANMNDPWDYHLFPHTPAYESWLYGKMSNYWMRKTLRRADLLTFPCRRLGEFTMRLAGLEREFEVVPHVGMVAAAPEHTEGFRIVHAGEPEVEGTAERAEGFRIVHAGKLGAAELTGRRSVAALLTGVEGLLKERPEARGATRLVLVGPPDPSSAEMTRNLGLETAVENTGTVSYEQSLRQISRAAVCVLVEGGMDEGIYLPSKFADYIAARKPVLALSPARGTIADFSPDPGLTRIDVDDANGAERAVEALYDDWRAGRMTSRRPSERLTKTFDGGEVAGKFLSLVERTITKKRT